MCQKVKDSTYVRDKSLMIMGEANDRLKPKAVEIGNVGWLKTVANKKVVKCLLPEKLWKLSKKPNSWGNQGYKIKSNPRRNLGSWNVF